MSLKGSSEEQCSRKQTQNILRNAASRALTRYCPCHQAPLFLITTVKRRESRTVPLDTVSVWTYTADDFESYHLRNVLVKYSKKTRESLDCPTCRDCPLGEIRSSSSIPPALCRGFWSTEGAESTSNPPTGRAERHEEKPAPRPPGTVWREG